MCVPKFKFTTSRYDLKKQLNLLGDVNRDLKYEEISFKLFY